MIMGWIKNKLIEQTATNSGVVPEQRWAEREKCFYLNSPAGLIKYKPKLNRDIARFRDIYINQFDSIKISNLKPQIKEELFFRLYAEIRAAEKVSYKANVRTRLKGAMCSS